MQLLAWWRVSQRHFPWRETRNPYHILVAEVLLHRTRAEQVVPAYTALIEHYPTVTALAAAPLRDLHASLHSLGLRWRVEMLHSMSVKIVDQFSGQIPQNREDLLRLPGVGPYIAAAVRCFGFGEADPILDTNTVRIVSRVFSLARTDNSRRSQLFLRFLQILTPTHGAREFNFALLDHGALICRSRNPLCSRCPVAEHCAFAQLDDRRPMATVSQESRNDER